MSDDLTEQKVWNDIARAYEKVIIRTTFYQEMMDKMREQVGDAKEILDLGCGVGYLMNSLLENKNRYVKGVDTNVHMLKLAEEEVIDKKHVGRYDLVQGDAADFDDGKKYDCIVTSNVIFNLKDPYSFIDNAFNLLKPGGKLVMTSAGHDPDLEIMIDSAVDEFKKNGIYGKDLKKHVDIVKTVNQRFMGAKGKNEKLFTTFSKDEISNILKDYCGFDKINHSSETYLDQNFLVAASKPANEVKTSIHLAESKEDLASVYSLRYHMLHDRIGYLNDHPEKQEETKYDNNATTVIAKDDAGKIVGCLSLIEHDDIHGIPEQSSLILDDKHIEDENLAAPFRWMVLPAYRNTDVGRDMFKELMNISKKKGHTYWAFPINPKLENYFVDKVGAKKVGDEYPCHNKTAIPVHLDLKKIDEKVFG